MLSKGRLFQKLAPCLFEYYGTLDPNHFIFLFFYFFSAVILFQIIYFFTVEHCLHVNLLCLDPYCHGPACRGSAHERLLNPRLEPEVTATSPQRPRQSQEATACSSNGEPDDFFFALNGRAAKPEKWRVARTGAPLIGCAGRRRLVRHPGGDRLIPSTLPCLRPPRGDNQDRESAEDLLREADISVRESHFERISTALN